MPPVLTEAARTSSRRRISEPKPPAHDASGVLKSLEQHVLLDGFQIVFDLELSRGSYMFDAATLHRLIDLYGFFGSEPGRLQSSALRQAGGESRSPPRGQDQDRELGCLFGGVCGISSRPSRASPVCRRSSRYLFIEGGALAIENTLKAAMDWKVRKNMAAGLGERGTEILHFRHAFHGRSGYTMSLTNTDPRKTDLFAKFNWPRVSTPSIDFSLPETERENDVIACEKKSEREIMKFVSERGVDIAGIIIEPIQGEGGDNHFRGEWLQTLRRICDENEMLLIFDEVQCGMGTTGKNWCCQHFGVLPDLLAFGKKVQVCGVMAGPRLDEVKDNAFRLPSRLNSTWGGNFTDMVRSKHFLQIVEEENLVENAAKVGARIVESLHEIASGCSMMSAVRGRGLFIAFDLPDPATRDALWKSLYEAGLLVLKSGARAIRFRPALDLTPEVADEAMAILRQQCRR